MWLIAVLLVGVIAFCIFLAMRKAIDPACFTCQMHILGSYGGHYCRTYCGFFKKGSVKK